MACSKMLSFAEIVQGRDSSVRITHDGLFDVVDTVMVLTGKNCNHSNEVLRNLKPSLYATENFVMRHGRRYATPKDIIQLIMVLPGKIAKEIRCQFAAIIEDYVQKHAVTDAEGTIHVPAPGSVPVQTSLQTVSGSTEMILEERKRKWEREDVELQDKRIQNMSNFLGLMARIRPNWMETDARFRLQTEDMIKNILTPTPVITNAITNGEGNAITNGEGNANSINNPIRPASASISISQIAQEHGKRLTSGQAIHAGKIVAEKYRAKYGCEPGKHFQWVEGVERPVNSYTERDRVLVVDALKEMGIM